MLTPSESTLEAELFGDLAAILDYAQGEHQQARKGLPEMRLSVVAGVGFEPTTFRL